MLIAFIFLSAVLAACAVYLGVSLRMAKKESVICRQTVNDCPYLISALTFPGLKYLKVSAGAERLCGLEPRMYIGHTMQEMVHPDDYAIIQGIIQENVSKRHYEGIFARVRTASSNWQWTKTSAILVKDVNGDDQLICYTYDINDLVDAREELRQAEDRYSLLLQNTFDVAWLLDIETRKITFLSEISYEHTGVDSRPAGSVLNSEEIFPAEDIAMCRSMINRRIKDLRESNASRDKPEENNIRVRNADGSLIWSRMRSTLYKDKFGRLFLAGVTHRIFMSTVSNAGSGGNCESITNSLLSLPSVRVFWMDQNKMFLGCNAAFAMDMGFPAPKFITGKQEAEIAKIAKGWEPYRPELLTLFESGQSVSGKLVLWNKADGTTGLSLYNLSAMYQDDGQFCGVMGTYTAISQDALKRALA